MFNVLRPCRIVIAATTFMAISWGAVKADSMVINLGESHNGTAPFGSTPWLTADFESTTAGTVTLTLTNKMPTAEFAPLWLFNTSVNPSNLTFAYVSGPQPTSVTGGSTTGDPSIKAGTFNIEFDWTTANNSNRFKGGTTVVETITDMADHITAASFDSLSTGSQGGFLSAAKIQGIPSGGGTASGTIVNSASVPEPSSFVMAFTAILAMLVIEVSRRHRRLASVVSVQG